MGMVSTASLQCCDNVIPGSLTLLLGEPQPAGPPYGRGVLTEILLGITGPTTNLHLNSVFSIYSFLPAPVHLLVDLKRP